MLTEAEQAKRMRSGRSTRRNVNILLYQAAVLSEKSGVPIVFTRHVNPSHFKDLRGEGALNKQHNELLAGPHFRRNLSVHLRFIIAPVGQMTQDEPEAPSKRVKFFT